MKRYGDFTVLEEKEGRAKDDVDLSVLIGRDLNDG